MYYVITNDGDSLMVEDINPSSNRVIVMVHGWPISKEMYEYQKNFLVPLGFRVVSFDIRGFGYSSISGSGYNYEQLATDLKYVIDNLNIDQVILMGFSMGGAICVKYMSMFNNYKVTKLILAGAAAPSYTKRVNNPYGNTIEATNQLINNLENDRPKTVSDFGNNVFAIKHTEEFMEWFRSICYKGSGIGTIQTAISLRDEDVYNDLKNIKVPTLILHGKLDKICPFGFATIMNKEIPNSILKPFEYSGHGLFYDELNKFNNELLQFIR